MPWAGFELLTLGVPSSDEDHYTIPLPKDKYLFEIIVKLMYISIPKEKTKYLKYFFIFSKKRNYNRGCCLRQFSKSNNIYVFLYLKLTFNNIVLSSVNIRQIWSNICSNIMFEVLNVIKSKTLLSAFELRVCDWLKLHLVIRLLIAPILVTVRRFKSFFLLVFHA